MDKARQLQKIRTFIYQKFHSDETGHDFYHMRRVAKMAKTIALSENANSFICEIAGWVHDIGDRKLFHYPEQSREEMYLFFKSIHLEEHQINQIEEAIQDVSFSKGHIPARLKGKIVQDADRLDALGAVGIARTFAYGGAKGQLIYHPEKKEGTSIQHFYDKLLKLKDTMNTKTGTTIAEKRHRLLMTYLENFFEEWKN